MRLSGVAIFTAAVIGIVLGLCLYNWHTEHYWLSWGIMTGIILLLPLIHLLFVKVKR